MKLLSRFIFILLAALAMCGDVAFGRGGGGCLAEGTSVLTPQGQIAIECLTPGQQIYSVTRAGLQIATVTGVSRVIPTGFIEIDLPDEQIRATPEHPIEISPGTFLAAGRLQSGDTVVRWIGGRFIDCPVVAVHRVPADRPAYNLTVMPGETFLADGVVVHNKGCFLPDTPVLEPDGSSVPISTLRAGDAVMAFDADLHLAPAIVLEVVSIEVDRYLRIETDRVALSVTDEHPFFVGDGKFRSAEMLRPGNRVFAFDGHGLVPQTIRSITPVAGRVRVYNLRTDEPHTYFAAGIAVHNKGGGGGGGGGGGHGGGFGGGRFGSTSHGGGAPFDDGCCVLVGFLVVVGIAVKVINNFINSLSRFSGNSDSSGFELDFLHPPSVVKRKADETERLLQTLASSDPSFDPHRLRTLTRQVFEALQGCWQSQNYQPMQFLLTPGLFSQHQAQLAAMKDHHEINCIESLRIKSVHLVHVHSNPTDNQPDFTALITASARDYYIDSRTKKFLRGDRSPATFQEFWTFGRNQHGWVLRRIEQSRESGKLKEPNTVGNGMSAQSLPASPNDSGFHPHLNRVDLLLTEWSRTERFWDRGRMVDRASAVFTAFALSAQGNGTFVSAEDVDPPLLAESTARLQQQRQQGIRIELRNFDVRHVELIAVHRDADPSKDQFLARVDVHAQEIVTQNGQILRQDPDVRAFVRYCLFNLSNQSWKLHAILDPHQAAQYTTQNAR